MQRDFKGGVFAKSIEGGRAGAMLRFEGDALVGETAEGQIFRVPYRACELELGGASGRMWFCRTREPEAITLFCEEPGFREALGEQARRELGPQLEQLSLRLRAEGRRSLGLWLALGLLAVALLGGGYLGIKSAGQASVQMLPRSVDEQIGELAVEHMDLQGSVVSDPVLKEGIERIMKRLAPKPVDGFTFEPRVVDAAIVNAFALPGGPMVIYTGLIRAAKTPEQLAGVLAHEMSHVTRRHGMKRIAQSLGIVAAIQLLFGDVSGIAAVAVQVLQEGAVNSYSREQEHEADMDAVRTLARAQLDPNALADFFVILEKREGNLPGFVSWLGTHPDLSQRIKDVRAAATPIESKPLLDNWAELQKHAER
ncbi:MAG: M48 family metallopeptidase [Myxococcales bacterium]